MLNPSVGTSESVVDVYLYLQEERGQGATFGLHRSLHKFPLGNVVLIGARRRRTACARSSSIQLTRIELLQRTRSGAGRAGGGGG